MPLCVVPIDFHHSPIDKIQEEVKNGMDYQYLKSTAQYITKYE